MKKRTIAAAITLIAIVSGGIYLCMMPESSSVDVAQIEEAANVQYQSVMELKEGALVQEESQLQSMPQSVQQPAKNSTAGKPASTNQASKPAQQAQHTHTWTAHTEYITDTYRYTVYRCTHGFEFNSNKEAYAHYCEYGDKGDPCSYGAVNKTGTRQIPHTYYTCSCGARKEY